MAAHETVSPVRERNVTLDVLRGITILLVVLGHSIQYGSGRQALETGAFFDDFLFRLLYSFHMPLFAMLSGYALYWSMGRPVLSQLFRRGQTLLLPVLGWSVISQLYHALRLYLAGEPGMAFDRVDGLLSRSFYFNLVNCHWFLWAMFWCSLAVILVERLLKGSHFAYLALLLATLAAPAAMDLHSYLYPYFVIGYLLHKRQGAGKPLGVPGKGVTALCGAAFAGMLLCYSRDHYIYLSGLTLLGSDAPLRQLWLDGFRWIIGLLGCLLALLGIRALDVNRWREHWAVRALCALGRSSLGIYMANAVFGIELLPELTANVQPGLLLWVAETAVFLALCWPLLLLIRRLPLVRTVLLGAGGKPWKSGKM